MKGNSPILCLEKDGVTSLGGWVEEQTEKSVYPEYRVNRKTTIAIIQLSYCRGTEKNYVWQLITFREGYITKSSMGHSYSKV